MSDPRRDAVITLLTDFGARDSYVAEMKAAILERVPAVRCVDVTHEVAPGDVPAAAWLLARIWVRFPPGTVHLVVVDPTVGSARRPLAVRAAGRWLVGPDNGLVTFLERSPEGPGVRIDEAWALGGPAAAEGGKSASATAADRTRRVAGLSDTFHGRDLFAPAAARLAAGEPAEGIGTRLDPSALVRLEVPRPRRDGERVEGAVVHVDRFGTLVTNIPAGWLPEEPVARVGEVRVRGLARSYADVAPGEPLLVIGSVGTLELSVRDGSAAERWGIRRGAGVVVTPA